MYDFIFYTFYGIVIIIGSWASMHSRKEALIEELGLEKLIDCIKLIKKK